MLRHPGRLSVWQTAMSKNEIRGLNSSPKTAEAESHDLALVDTGGGCLVFRERRESRPHTGRELLVSRELLGFHHVTDWNVIREALQNRGLGVGAVAHLPEFDSLEEART